MTIKERIEKRVENGQRIVNEMNETRAQIQALQKKLEALTGEAIGNNEALKELREMEKDT